jgi:serine/threonine protein kinase/WD40 repeat protein
MADTQKSESTDPIDSDIRRLLEYEQALMDGLFGPLDGHASVDNQSAKTIRMLVDTFSAFENVSPEAVPPVIVWELPPKFGRFSIIKKLGNGAFGAVWKATDPNTDRFVAIKALHPELRSAPNLSQRFIQEAFAAARLNHPSIVRVLEAGTIDGISFIVTELVDGETLVTSTDGKPSYAICEAASIVMQLASAVQHSHQQGVLHRDIKPDNVLIERQTATDGTKFTVPRLTDFGLARLQDSRSELSQFGMMIGTLDYMAPEQLAGDQSNLGPGVDIYSLGLLLFELLTGTHPRRCGGNVLKAIEIRGQMPNPRSLRRDIPLDLDAICVRCLQKLPANRFPNAVALQRDLENFLEDRPTETRTPSLFERATRWGYANQVLASFLLMVSLSLVTIQVLTIRHRRELQTQNEHLIQARHASDAARSAAEEQEAKYRDLAWNSGIKNAYTRFEQGDLPDATRQLAALRRTHPSAPEYPEWYLLDAELKKQFEVLCDASVPIWELTPIPNSSRVAFGGQGSTLSLYDLETRTIEQRIEMPLSEIHAIAASPDGKFLVAGGQDSKAGSLNAPVQIDLESGRFKRLEAEQDARVESLAYSDQGDFLAVGFRYENIQIIPLNRTGAKSSITSRRRARSLSWTSKNEVVVHSDHGQLTLQDREGGTRQLSLGFHVEAFALQAFGEMLLVALADDDECQLIELREGKSIARLQDAGWRARSVSISEDGRWAAAGSSIGEVAVWQIPDDLDSNSLQTIRPYKVRRLLSGNVTSVRWHKDHLLCADDAGRLVKWKPHNEIGLVRGDLVITAATFWRDSLLVGWSDGSLNLFPNRSLPQVGDVTLTPSEIGGKRIIMEATGSPLIEVAVDPGSDCIVCGFRDGSLHQISRNESGEYTPQMLGQYPHSGFENSLQVRDGKVLFRTDSNMLNLMDLKNGREVVRAELPGHNYALRFFENASKVAAVGHAEGVHIYSVPTLGSLGRYGVGQAVSLFYDGGSGLLVSGHANGEVRWSDASNLTTLKSLRMTRDKVTSYTQDRDGRVGFSVSGHGSLTVCDPRDNLVFGTLASVPNLDRSYNHSRSKCEISADSRLVFTLEIREYEPFVLESTFRIYQLP